MSLDAARQDVVLVAKRLEQLWVYDGHPYSTYDDDLMVAEEHLLDACRKLVEAADAKGAD